jgi:hypothetical protein
MRFNSFLRHPDIDEFEGQPLIAMELMQAVDFPKSGIYLLAKST